MMQRFRAWLEPTATEPEIRQQQYLLNLTLLALAVPGFIFGLVMAALWALGKVPPAGAISGLGVQPFYLLSYWLARRGKVRLAAYIPATVVFLAMAGSLFQVGVGHVSTIGMALVVLTAGILIGVPAATVFVALSTAVYLLAGYAQAAGMLPMALSAESTVVPDAVGMGLGLLVLVLFNWVSNREIGQALARERELGAALRQEREILEQRVHERTQALERQAIQLQTTADIARLAAEAVAPDELIARAVEMIRERFGFYHASVFIVDDTGNWAFLAASTGEAGRRLMARRHRLAVGSASIVGWVTANRLPRLASDVTKDPFHFRNPLLPDTQAELAVPLMVGQHLIGVLDVQSTTPDAFSEADVRALQAIASELAIAIESARLLTDRRIEMERMESEMRTLAQEAWSDPQRFGLPRVLHIAPAGGETEVGPSDSPTIAKARREGATAISPDGREMAVPVSVRGAVVAVMAARKPADDRDPWSEDELALLEAVAGQTALALETARQYSEEQRRLSELEVLNRISQATSQLLRPDTLFRVVHRQINQVLGETDLFVALYDQENERVHFPYASEQDGRVELPDAPLGQDPISTVIGARQPLLLNEATGLRTAGSKARSWLGVPMMVGDEILGVIAVQDTMREGRFSEDDAALLATIAGQVATAVQNARLLEQVQRTARRERLIHEITSSVRRAPDMQTVLETAARELGRALNARQIAVRLGEPAPSKEPGGEQGNSDHDESASPELEGAV